MLCRHAREGSKFQWILNPGTRWGWAVTLKSCPLHPRNPLNRKVSRTENSYGRFDKLPFPSIEKCFFPYTFLASHFIDWAISQIFPSLEQTRLAPPDHHVLCNLSASNHPKFRTVYPVYNDTCSLPLQATQPGDFQFHTLKVVYKTNMRISEV